MTKIPKAQVGRRGQGSMSYSYLKDASSHNFIYMDNDKNKVLDLDQYPAMYSDNSSGFMICQKINDLTGKLERISLFDTKDADGLKVKDFFTARVLLLNQNEFGFELYKGKKEDVFFKVKIK